MTQETPRSRSAIAAHPFTAAAIAVLVVANIFFALYTPLYARLTPKLGDFPFFYWYQLIWVLITGVLMVAAFWAIKVDGNRRKQFKDGAGKEAGE
jgi:drug/metabolite transporter (DMT)-like permease